MKRCYNESELRSKLSKFANSRIESITCDDLEICVCFKDGFRNTYRGRYEKEVCFRSVAEMKEACTRYNIEENSEAVFSYMKEKFEEISPQAQALIASYSYSYIESHDVHPKEEYMDLEFKEGVLNDFLRDLYGEDKELDNSLSFRFDELDEGLHLIATQMEYFVGTPEYQEWLEKKKEAEARRKSIDEYIKKKLDEIAPNIIGRIRTYYHRDEKENYLYLQLKEGVLNDYSGSPLTSLSFSFEDLEQGKHIDVTKPDYFVGTPEHTARIKKEK